MHLSSIISAVSVTPDLLSFRQYVDINSIWWCETRYSLGCCLRQNLNIVISSAWVKETIHVRTHWLVFRCFLGGYLLKLLRNEKCVEISGCQSKTVVFLFFSFHLSKQTFIAHPTKCNQDINKAMLYEWTLLVVIASSVLYKTNALSQSKESAFWPSNGNQSFSFLKKKKKAYISHQTQTHVTLQHFRKRLCSCRCRSNVIYLFIWVIDTGTSITHPPTREWSFFLLQRCY